MFGVDTYGSWGLYTILPALGRQCHEVFHLSFFVKSIHLFLPINKLKLFENGFTFADVFQSEGSLVWPRCIRVYSSPPLPPPTPEKPHYAPFGGYARKTRVGTKMYYPIFAKTKI